MPSPFPGMDPYLESPVHWGDFHHVLIGAMREVISASLPRNYFAKIDEHVVVVDPEFPDGREFVPDVLVGREQGQAQGGAATAVELSPHLNANIRHVDPHREGFIEIRRMPDRELITTIELMSPANKNGGRGQYLEKRQAMMEQGVSVVELDLLRGGRRLQLVKRLPPGHYFAFVSRSERQPACEVYAWTVRDRLPRIPIPLRAPDDDAGLDLALAVATSYDRGPYARMIDYTKPPKPPFEPEVAEWVAMTARSAIAPG